MRILGIETSCDETAAAVVGVHGSQFTVHSNVVASQVKLHAKTGGVVPEVAARKHMEMIVPVVKEALLLVKHKSQILSLRDISRRETNHKQIQNSKFKTNPKSEILNLKSDIDAIAVTVGPGLLTSLLVGVETARTLGYLWNKPVIAVNHLEGHIYANWLLPVREILNPKLEILNKFKIQNSKYLEFRVSNLEFPAIVLLVSGGHTELVLMRKHLDYKVIGSTRDDAAGECFDKVAKMLGLGYPGGPQISAKAEISRKNAEKDAEERGKFQRESALRLPRPMIDSKNFDFSFSGLKTAVLYSIKNLQSTNYKLQANLCAEVQQAIVDVLVAKTIRAAKQYKVKTIMLGGGVSANKELRKQLVNAVNSELLAVNCILPEAEYATDNAAMIAAAGYFKARHAPTLKNLVWGWQKLKVDPNLDL